MSTHNNVAWLESQFLFPHHFQQHDRYMEQRIEARCRPIRRLAWGFEELKIDEAALLKGDIGLDSARGILPDGTPFQFPQQDVLPAPVRAPRAASNQLVYLTLPEYRPGARLVDTTDMPSDHPTRFRLEELDVYDYCGGNTVVERVETCALQCRLTLDESNLGGFTRVPVAKVKEVTAEGAVLLDRDYIPPCLNTKAHPAISHFLTDVLARLNERGEALAQRFTASGQANSSAVIADFMLLQLINRWEPYLRHWRDGEPTHPEVLYQTLLSLAGELATFTTPDKRPLEAPAYCHDDPASCFQPLALNLNRHLSAVLERTAVHLALEQRNYGIRVARVEDRTLLHQGRLVLAVKAEMPTEELRDRVPTHFKVGTVETIRDLVNNQLPGIELSALPVAPREIPYHAGSLYFELDRSGEYWQRLKRSSGGLALHVTGDFPGIELDLWAVRE